MSDVEARTSSIVNWQDAEVAAAKHMREILRFTNVGLSRVGADGGVDVKAVEGVAQVKWYASPVGIADVQRLRGSTSGTQWAIFYASGRGYTKSAMEAATRGNVALFTLLKSTGMAVAVNHVAQSLERVRLGIPQKTQDDGALDIGARMATSRRHWELNQAVRAFEARVQKIDRAVGHMQHVLRDLEEYEPGAVAALRTARQVWPEEQNPSDYARALEQFKKSIDWVSHFAEGVEANRMQVIAFQEAALLTLPALTESFISAVPVSRNGLNEWCDYWIERLFWVEFEAPRTLPKRAWFRDYVERRIERGPNRADRERLARELAVRVVL